MDRELQAQIDVCNESFFEQHGNGGYETKDPIVILGLPRSGSTLIEQILASHSIKITPGIRDTTAEDDQARTLSAKEAIERGSTFLVIGRPITQAEDIAQALQNFNNSIYEK